MLKIQPTHVDGNSTKLAARRYPIGAELQGECVSFRVWAPDCKAVEVVIDQPRAERQPAAGRLTSDGDGYYGGQYQLIAGDRYWFRLDGSNVLLPDPASRYQPNGPEGASQIVDHGAFAWSDQAWPGLPLADGPILYELHIGAFTPAGTWQTAAEQLPELAKLGITTLEVMPICEFPGEFGWSYDGANLFAPTHLYGTPDDMRAFIDAAHRLGIGVVMDIVYNHLGSVGENLLTKFSESYFSKADPTEWGKSVNFDGPGSAGVREFFLANARYWIDEFHVDGFRIDATQAFNDQSKPHIVTEVCRTARQAANNRRIFMIGESEPQDSDLLRSEPAGGHGLDANWNDDFHHSAMVRLTGHSEAYFSDHHGDSAEFVASAEWGYLFQGQRYAWQKNPRGKPALDLPAACFINYLQNHDQVGNSVRGERVHRLTSPGRFRAMTAVLLLGPQTPLLLQGQEFASSAPFIYFNDCGPDLGPAVRAGRGKFMRQFPSANSDAVQNLLPDPADPAGFQRCKLDFSERETHADVYLMHGDLIRLRQSDPVLNSRKTLQIRGGTLGKDAFFLRFFAGADLTGPSRILLVNFGVELHLPSIANPLIAPPRGQQWQTLWASESPQYGGRGVADPETEEGWRISGESAVLLASQSIPPSQTAEGGKSHSKQHEPGIPVEK